MPNGNEVRAIRTYNCRFISRAATRNISRARERRANLSRLSSAMKSRPDARREAVLYWSAVSLIVCEGLSIRKAADRLGVDGERLRHILRHRRSLRPFGIAPDTSAPGASSTSPAG
ncbi:MAG TPA: hypothetical protein VF193_13820 [Steroidobacter sp.]